MGLNVPKFFDFAPHLPFRFEAEIFLGSKKLDASALKFAVQSVKISGAECDTAAAATYYGDGYKTIPVWNTSRTMTIDFEETDDMQVTRMFDEITNSQRNGTPWIVGVHLREFDTKFKRTVSDRFFKCTMQSFDEPAFSRTGRPGPVTVSATFIIMSETPWTAENAKNQNVGAAEQQNTSDVDLSNMFAAETKQLKNSQAIVAAAAEWKDEFDKAYQAGKDNKNSTSNVNMKLRPKIEAIQSIQDNEKQVAKENNLSYAAVAMANGGEQTQLSIRGLISKQVATNGSDKITKAELEKARKIQAELDNAYGGKELQKFVEELSNKQYLLGGKGKDGDISKAEGLDCSGGAGAWAERMGYHIDEAVDNAKSGRLVKKLVEQGATDVGQNYDSGLKPGDILNKSSTAAGNSGHVRIFLGYDGSGNMLISEVNGHEVADGMHKSAAGGRIDSVPISKMKKDGYIAVKIMDNAKARNKK